MPCSVFMTSDSSSVQWSLDTTTYIHSSTSAAYIAYTGHTGNPTCCEGMLLCTCRDGNVVRSCNGESAKGIVHVVCQKTKVIVQAQVGVTGDQCARVTSDASSNSSSFISPLSYGIVGVSSHEYAFAQGVNLFPSTTTAL